MLTSEVPVFQTAFISGSIIEHKWGDLKIDVHEIGHLNINSGKVMACDPFVELDAVPFEQKVPIGKFPVIVSVITIPSDNDQRIAFAKLQFSHKEITRWRMATKAGQKLESLKKGHIFGYGVDSGTGCFCDARALELLNQKYDEDEEYYEIMVDALDETYRATWAWANHYPSDENEENIIMFSSGIGDGHYASYFGYTSSGVIGCLITNFSIFSVRG